MSAIPQKGAQLDPEGEQQVVLCPQHLEILAVMIEIRDILRRLEGRGNIDHKQRSKVRKRRGPKRFYDPLKDSRLVEDWQQSRLTKQEYERERNLEPGMVQKAVDRCRKRCQDL